MWEIIRANKRKSIYLVIVMAALLFATGYFSGELLVGRGHGLAGLLIAAVIWFILTMVAYFQGKHVFLAVAGAQKIKKSDHPRLFNVVEEMVIASQLPKIPDIYIIDDPAPNAFATGRNPENAAVAVTTGLLNSLDRDELQGVIAHEIGHIKNRDILFMTMVGVLLGTIVLLADITVRTMFYSGGRRRSRTSSSGGGQVQMVIIIVGLVLMILAPLVAQLIYFAVSRKREFLADASSAQFTRFPEGLARALEKIAHTPVKMKKVNRVTAPMYIINPMEKMNVTSLTSTHPPVEQRVKILRQMSGGIDFAAYNKAFQKVTGASKPVIPASALKQGPPSGKAPAPKQVPRAGVPGVKTGLAGAVLMGAASAMPEPRTPAEKARETVNALWKAKNYKFISCDCGAILKVPPACQLKEIKCLRCKKKHSLRG